jgi:hypothetical protein
MREWEGNVNERRKHGRALAGIQLLGAALTVYALRQQSEPSPEAHPAAKPKIPRSFRGNGVPQLDVYNADTKDIQA